MDNDNSDLNQDNEYESSTPSWISALLIIALVLACGAAIYFSQRDPGNRACVQNDLTLQAQSAEQKANMEYQTARHQAGPGVAVESAAVVRGQG